jgi:hypothetical protein
LKAVDCLQVEEFLPGQMPLRHWFLWEMRIKPMPPGVSMKSVVVEQRLDGSIHIIYNGRELKYKKIHTRPPRPKEQKSPRPRKTYIPPPDHPWRRLSIVSSDKINEPVC